ncbi:MAG: nicotinate (nicotinamide) nucleotide adenylyltransferase [Limisphaerales bacterium]
MRLGLFGGSFNPVHLGHLLVAQAALEELDLDRLFFIPAARSPFKPGQVLAPPAARVRLLRLALAGWKRCEVDTQELGRGGISYTIDTARDLARRFPGAELFWLIGADHLPTLPTWREAESLAELLEFVVVPRPGPSSEAPPPSFRVRSLTGFPAAISASEIRARIQAGKPVDLLVTPAVAEAIRNNRLYL